MKSFVVLSFQFTEAVETNRKGTFVSAFVAAGKLIHPVIGSQTIGVSNQVSRLPFHRLFSKFRETKPTSAKSLALIFLNC